MTEIHLYKLTSGETVIGEFHKAEVINERTNEMAHIVGYPTLVPSGRYLEMREWVPGYMGVTIPISTKNMMFVITGDEVDSVLVECYQQYIHGDEGA